MCASGSLERFITVLQVVMLLLLSVCVKCAPFRQHHVLCSSDAIEVSTVPSSGKLCNK